MSSEQSGLCQETRLLLAYILIPTGPLQVAPSETLPMDGESWEADLSSLWIKVLKHIGFTLEAVTRLPYICEGDLDVDYYTLDDAMLVLSKT